MKPVLCNLCGADDYSVVFARGVAQLHQIVRCRKCGLMYANPQELVDCEKMAGAAEQIFDPDTPGARQYVQKQFAQVPDYLRALETLNRLFPQRGKLLEIGSYMGILLDQFRAAGWTTTGLEPHAAVAAYARAKYGLEIVTGVLPQSSLPENSFDAVVMLHVIEHMPDPAANLREIRRLLKTGGALVVETPRFDSLIFKILGRRERSLSNTNGHIYFFSTSTLQQLLEKNGFEVISTELVGRTLTLDRFFCNVGIILRNEGARKMLDKISAVLRLDKIRFHVNVRDMQRIYCRAKS